MTFHISVGHLYILGGECLLRSSDYFLIGLFCCCWVLWILLDINLVSELLFANIFSYLMGCLFVLLKVSFAVKKIFSLIKCHSITFAFTSLGFEVKFIKSSLRPRFISLEPVFLLCNLLFQVLYFGLWSILSSFLCMATNSSPFHSFACCLAIFQALFIEEAFFFPLYVFIFFVKNHLCIYMWVYFWTLNSVPLVCVSVFLPVPCCFNYCRFVV